MTDSYDYSSDDLYRWTFERRWDDGPLLCWIGLNPSTGDKTHRPRPTLRKVTALAKSLDMGGLIIVNLFAYRATSPRDLKAAAKRFDIVGEEDDAVIRDAVARSQVTLAAWGCHGRLQGRGDKVAVMVPDAYCLGLTQGGEPRHPLYAPTVREALRPLWAR